jgi:lycopene beta-cyclase
MRALLLLLALSVVPRGATPFLQAAGAAGRPRCKSCLAAGGAPSSSSSAEAVDVVVIGSGPAGSTIAALLGKRGLSVAMLDRNIDKGWLPNYGVWCEEWDWLDQQLELGTGGCLSRTWQKTDCFYGGSHGVPNDERLTLPRPYARVDRAALKATLRQRMDESGVHLIREYVDPKSVVHGDSSSSLTTESGMKLKAKLIVDCTGHETGLIERQGPHDPGFQIAYGIECEVESGYDPYDPDAMLFMDYRTDWAKDESEARELAEIPTFLYAMPLGNAANGKERIFLEETSLVARPAITFEMCKERLYKRLSHHGIKVSKVDEEEFCYIPMGGSLPKFTNRVVAFGGASGAVHAATGYMIVRMMAQARATADSIAGSMKADYWCPKAAAREAYMAMWPANARSQRGFHVFGGEFLMQQDVVSLRGFFSAFFKIPLPYWAGFLSGYPGLPHNQMHAEWGDRAFFGVQLFFQAPFLVQSKLMLSGALMGWKYGLIQSVTPLADQEFTLDETFVTETNAIREAEAKAATVAAVEPSEPVLS